MGMYTHVRGWIRLEYGVQEKEINNILENAKRLSNRSECCVNCCIFHIGFNLESYIFIGGEIKNYDDDWSIFLNYLKKIVRWTEAKMEMKYEEDEIWSEIIWSK
jgi:hypothetical protein